MKYLVFGETIWDVYPDKRVIGGASFNFAANAAILGGEVAFVTGVGRDDLGKSALGCIEKYGIRTDLVCENNKATGQCIVTLGDNGIPQYKVLTDTAYDNITADAGMIEKIHSLNPDVFYFNTLTQRNPVSRKAVHTILESFSFAHIFSDINIRTGCWDRDSLELCMRKSDMVKISDEEAHFLSDCGLIDISNLTFAEAVHMAFPNIKLLIFTMGAEGSEVYDFENGTFFSSGKPDNVNVVSTVGAGDCYSASFLHTYLTTGSIPEAVRTAADRSSIVVSHTEAIPWDMI